jgi:hypothetical protein
MKSPAYIPTPEEIRAAARELRRKHFREKKANNGYIYRQSKNIRDFITRYDKSNEIIGYDNF